MKKIAKPRAVGATVKCIPTLSGDFYLVTPYDRKIREIPSSVQCGYNSLYFSLEEAEEMVRAI
jgi:hypothetical protein